MTELWVFTVNQPVPDSGILSNRTSTGPPFSPESTPPRSSLVILRARAVNLLFWSSTMVDPDEDLILDWESAEEIHEFGAGGQWTQLV